jgi:hypothetical protein
MVTIVIAAKVAEDAITRLVHIGEYIIREMIVGIDLLEPR